MRYLIIFLLLFIGCDDDPVSPIHGCLDSQACNYNSNASIDNNSCTYADEGYDCEGSCTLEFDCLGECGGTAEVDECGTCNGFGIAEGTCDCDGNLEDCAGNCGGNAVVDECGICDSDSSNNNTTCIQDCNGIWGGSSTLDACGTCDSDSSNNCIDDCMDSMACNYNPLAVVDFIDSCEYPTNDNTNCDGSCGGINMAISDECGVCDTDSNNDCIQDCYGIWGGTAINCETLLEVSSEFYVLPQGNELNIIETIVNASLLIPTTVTSSGNIINNIGNDLIQFQSLTQNQNGELTQPIGSFDPTYSFTNESGTASSIFNMGNDVGLATILITAPEFSLSDTLYITLNPK